MTTSRYHNTFRARDKVMRGFGGKQKQQVENHRTYYNFMRPHTALKGLTPAQRAGIPQENNWKELLEKSIKV